jgi:hypothetical protein
MISKLIHYISLAAVIVIAVSFGLFALDEAKLAGDGKRVNLEAGGSQAQPVVLRDEHGRQLGRSDLRVRIDDMADRLTGPLETAHGSKDPWMMRGSAFLLGLVFWGLILHWLARSLAIWTSGGSSRPATRATY